jgi:pimeloyl-ACP methyl ester carboxylesterase
VVGELDVKFLQLAQTMLPSLRRASLVEIADAGHDLVLEQPEAIIALMAEELRAVG